MVRQNSDPNKLHSVLVFIRRTLGKLNNCGQDYASLGLTAPLVELLRSKVEQICLDAAWALTNLAAGSHDAVPQMRAMKAHHHLLALLATGNDAVKEQALWVLGNIVGDSAEARDEMVGTELVERLAEIISAKTAKLTLLQVACWVISGVLKGRPFFDRVKGLVERMGNLLYIADQDVIADTLWGLAFFTDEPKDSIKLVRKSVSITMIVEFLKHENLLIKRAALRLSGNICVGDNDDVDDVIKAGCLPELIKILNTCEQREALKETCWVLSNVAACSEPQVDQLIAAKAIKALVSVCRSKFDLYIKREAVWALANACMAGTARQVQRLVDKKVLEAMLETINVLDPQAELTLLQAIDHVLASGSTTGITNNIAAMFDLIGGRARLEQLQAHANPQIYKTAVAILEKYYKMDESQLTLSLAQSEDSDSIMPAENARPMAMEDAQSP